MNYSFFHYTGPWWTQLSGKHPILPPPYSGPDKHLGYPALESILKLQPDFFVGTGDNVYYDHPGHHGRAQTQHEMRKKHHEQYSQPRFLDLFRRVATYWLKDDHDHRFDDSDQINPVRIGFAKRLPLLPEDEHLGGRVRIGFRAAARAGSPHLPRATPCG